MSIPPDEDFLSRWSRRKRSDQEAEPAAATPEQHEDPAEAPPPDETDEEILARLELPDPDTLESGDDFSRFMAAAVPEHLRRRALRRLWRSNPALVVLDGLNEYDEDYTKGFVPAGTLKTAYQVGRGFVSRISDAAEADVDDGTDDAAAATNAPDNNTQEIDEAPEPAASATAKDPDPEQKPLEETELAVRATRRRMQFRVSPND